MIARGDQGGLAAQTFEAFRHLHPAATVVMDLGAGGRGPTDAQPYQACEAWGGEMTVVQAMQMPPEAAAWLAKRCDVIFTAETTYGAHVPGIAEKHGAQVVVQANPELYRADDYPGARIVLPTAWEAERVPAAERVLPVPVATDMLTFTRRTRCQSLYHPAAPAMADRNGTMLVASALPHVRTGGLRLVVRGTEGLRLSRRGRHSVEVVMLGPQPGPYHAAYPDDVDVMLLPRRFAGNFMPAQEAAALGVPVIALDLAPQADWPHVVGVPTTTSQEVAMRGGTFAVHACDPRVLAAQIDALAADPDRVAELSTQGRQWAEGRSWAALTATYVAALAPV